MTVVDALVVYALVAVVAVPVACLFFKAATRPYVDNDPPTLPRDAGGSSTKGA